MSFLSLTPILIFGCVFSARGLGSTVCPGKFNMQGYGSVEMVPSGWNSEVGAVEVSVHGEKEIEPNLFSRAYFADACSAGQYKQEDYVGLNLLGKTFRYTTDLSTATCGCNAALYLVSMKQNAHRSECGDFYCDANNVCGESCAEIDIQEGSAQSWHSTLHTATDKSGLAGGYGGGQATWSGPRDWTSAEYGLGGKCVDTKRPFDVAVSFPVDKHGKLKAVEITLSQSGSHCPLRLGLGNYTGNSSVHHDRAHGAMEELTAALAAGMTPVVSYWSSSDMFWLDGEGKDSEGPCHTDEPKKCGESVRFSDFSIADIGSEAADFIWHDTTITMTTTTTPMPTTTQPSWVWTPEPAWTSPPAWTPEPSWTTPSAWTPPAKDQEDHVVLIVESDHVPPGFEKGKDATINGQTVKVVGVGNGGVASSTATVASPMAPCKDAVKCPTVKDMNDKTAWVFLKKNLRLGGPIRFAGSESRPVLLSGLGVVALVCAATIAVVRQCRAIRTSLARPLAVTEVTAAADQGAGATGADNGGLQRGARATQSCQHLLNLAEPNVA